MDKTTGEYDFTRLETLSSASAKSRHSDANCRAAEPSVR